MKKVIVFVLAFFLVFTALAEKKTFYVYDADEHDYEGRVVWSSDAEYYDEEGKMHSTFIWHMLNLKTGKYTTDESRDSYIIMDDGTIEGFLAAKEEDGYVTVYNVKSGYESEILFTCSLEEGYPLGTGLPMTVRAYMDEYLYFIQRREKGSGYEYVLKRKNMKGDEYEYSAYDGMEVALYKNGTCAWVTEDETEMHIESPDRRVFMTLNAQDADGAVKLRTAAWLNEKRLLFWAFMTGDYDGILYSFNVETGKVKKYTDEKGGDIIIPGGRYPYGIMMDVNDKYVLYMDHDGYGDDGFGEPVLWDLKKNDHITLYASGLRVYGMKYREMIREALSYRAIPILIRN